MTSPSFVKAAWTVALLAACSAAAAQRPAVKVDGAWARATVHGQKGTGAFMNITAKDGTRLVGVSSPAAGVAEVHEMKMENDIMKMRPVNGVDLPAGQTVSLKPGGYHVMLLDLKAPLANGSTVPVTLRFKDPKGVESKLDVVMPVGFAPPVASPPVAAPPAAAATGAGGKAPEHKH